MFANAYNSAPPPLIKRDGTIDGRVLTDYLSREFNKLQRTLAAPLQQRWQWLGLSLGDGIQIPPGTLTPAYPSYDETNAAMEFPQNDTGEYLHFQGRLPLGWVGGDGRSATLKPRILYIQDEAEVPTFKISYKFGQPGSALTAASTDSATETSTSYSTGSILQEMAFPDITLDTQIAGLYYEIKLYRDDNTVSGDVLVKHFDVLIQAEDLGSALDP